MKRRSPLLSPVPNPLTEQLHQILYPYGVGIDTHSQFIQACVLRTANRKARHGRVMRHEREFPTTWQGLKAAHRWILQHVPKHTRPKELRYCIESTATYHLPVLRAFGGIPCVVNPLLAAPTRRKTDVLDARLLAHYSITGVWKPSFIPSEQAQELRVLWAQRREAVRLATRASNRINNIILRFGHTFVAQHGLRTAEGEGILTDLLDGRAPKADGVCPDGLPVSVRPLLSSLFQEMKGAIKAAQAATRTALDFIAARSWPTGHGDLKGQRLIELLTTVPGVGEVTALTWLAEVADPTRFDHPKQVAAFAGCDPSLKISAGKVTSHARRTGDERLHQALLYAASGVLRLTDSPLGQWGRSIAGRHKVGGHRKACGAVARRIACALWHVHRKAEPFSYAQYTLAQRLVVPYTKLAGFLPPRIVKLLAASAITTSQQLADAFNQGQLASIHGLGDTTLKNITQWMRKFGKRQPTAAADHPTMSDATDAEHLARRALKTPSGKDYPLRPALTFPPRSKIKTKGVAQLAAAALTPTET